MSVCGRETVYRSIIVCFIFQALFQCIDCNSSLEDLAPHARWWMNVKLIVTGQWNHVFPINPCNQSCQA